LFLRATLAVFDKANLVLQKDEPCIHVMRSVLLEQLKTLLTHFIKPPSLRDNKDCLYELPFDQPQHQKADEDLFIGTATREFMKEN
jgi:hypothetical protein